MPFLSIAVRLQRSTPLALHADSMSAAEVKQPSIWQQFEGWEAKLAGNTTDAEARFEAARQLAQMRGFRYMQAEAFLEAREMRPIACLAWTELISVRGQHSPCMRRPRSHDDVSDRKE